FTVTISNRGIRLADVSPAANGSERAKRRGWGLELMRRLMDEVRIEETDDGTRIRMTKFAVNPD
ncbi:ATP-binding protein, partial [Escherichia coli]|nr:ATP-binding protein [Escherichia coli]